MNSQHYEGIYAATLNPMHDNYKIDEAALCKHVSSIAHVAGMRGLLVNGHAGENFLTTADEKKRVIELCRANVPEGCLLIAGINAESSLEAVAQAEDAAQAGADALLIFPPNSWILGPHPDTVLKHHRIIIEACKLPIMLYQAPVAAGSMAYQPDLLSQLIQLPRIVGIKEGSWEVTAYEANRRLVKSIAPHIAVMASGDEHLLTSFILGSDGSQVSLAVIIPQEIIALETAVKKGDIATAQSLHEVIYPLAKAIYGTPPSSYATARLKACLQLLGHIPNATCRPPIGPVLPQPEINRLDRLLKQLGLNA